MRTVCSGVPVPGDAGEVLADSLDRILTGSYRVDDLELLLGTTDPQQEAALFAAANRVREEAMGPGVHLRALIEFSNHCSGGCAYCGLRARNAELVRYRMEPDEIVDAAAKALSLGYKTVVLQSGEDRWFSREIVADLVRRIKALGDIALTLCLGERPREDYVAWKEAGADRYLVRIETSNRALYERLHPGMSFENRLRCLRDLRELGFQVGSGVLVGLPDQTLRMLAEDLLFLRDLKADMVGMGPFIPHEQTPLAEVPQGSVELVLRMMALVRLLLPECYVVSTTALGTLDPQGRERGLQAGGNVMMPNCTPRKYRAMYEIYPNKICVDEEPEQCRGCLTGRIRSIGREIAEDQGNAPWTSTT
jgi:biotin synthase